MNEPGDDKARDPSHTELPPLDGSCGQKIPLWIRSSFVRSAGDGVEKLLFYVMGCVSQLARHLQGKPPMQPVIAGVENPIERIPGLPLGFSVPLTGFRPTIRPINPLGLHLVLIVFVPVDMFAKLSFEAAPAVDVRIPGDIFAVSYNDSFIRGLLIELGSIG